jgi:hypothetical protein
MKYLLSILILVGTSSLVHAKDADRLAGDDPNLSKNYDGQFADTYIGTPDKSKSQAVPCPTCSRNAAKIKDQTTFGQKSTDLPGDVKTEGEH